MRAAGIDGKPIGFLLTSLGATVTTCHHMTRSVAMHSRAADPVFVAVGKPGLMTVATLMKNAVLATRLQMDHYRDAYARTDV